MRRPRVIIFDDGSETKKALTRFFAAGGYEMMVVPRSEFCPFYASPGTSGRVCCDIAVVVEKRQNKNADKILLSHCHHNCRLKPSNRAIISGVPAAGQGDVVKAMGAKVFRDPLDTGEFEAWVKRRRTLMDLSLPLAIRRKAVRRTCPADMKIHCRVLKRDAAFQAHALNESTCGICIRTRHALKLRQVTHLWSDESPLSEDAEVRWIQMDGDGTHLIGLTFCIA
jgi:PilZ domain